MTDYHVSLSNYSVGENCYRYLKRTLMHYGKKVVIIGGKTALEKAKDAILKEIENTSYEVLGTLWYGGNATYEHVERLIREDIVQEADVIFGVGGGRALDTCKVVADKLQKPLFTFPTIASNCAACTCISVMYHNDNTFCNYYYPSDTPVHVFIHTRIIAEAPYELLWAGIGDALSKEYEVLLASRHKKLSHTPFMGVQMSKVCTEPLLEYGKQALEECRRQYPGEALTQVILDIIISTGMVSNMTNGEDYYYNSSLAHCVYYGSTLIENASKHLHGEIVSFGVLCLLTYDEQWKEREKIALFNKSVGLPITLADINIDKEHLQMLSDKASSVIEWSCVPYEMSKEKFIQAMLACDTYGRQLKSNEK